MKSSVGLSQVERQVRRSFYQDGLVEIGQGMLFLFMGGMLAFGRPAGVAFIVVCAGGLAAAVLLGKRQLVYPRIGYATLDKGQTKLGGIPGTLLLGSVIAGAVLVIGAIVGGAFMGREAVYHAATLAIPAAFGMVIGGVMASHGVWYGLPRWVLLGAGALLIGAASGVIGAARFPSGSVAAGRAMLYETLGLQMLAMGILWLGAGAGAMVGFLRHHPVPPEGESDGTR